MLTAALIILFVYWLVPKPRRKVRRHDDWWFIYFD